MPRSTHSVHLITESSSTYSEMYNQLRTNIDFSNVDEKVQTVVVTSSKLGEGKSTTAANLAVAYAQSGKKVLLMDADLRKPSQHHIFDIPNEKGLTSYLSQQHDSIKLMAHTMIPNLHVMPAGPTPPNASEMIGSKRMKGLLEELKGQYDMIILDTPPVTAVSDAQVLGAQCDGVVLVILAGKLKKDAAVKAKAKLDRVKARVLGVVINKANRSQVSEEQYDLYYGAR